MIRVLIVDDSAFMRRLLVRVLEPYDDIEVVDTAMDGVFALEKIERLESGGPDVVTLDLDMPRLDGMTTLKRIVDKFQLPVVLVSAHTSNGAQATFDGLAAGAVDFVTKPEQIFSSPVTQFGDHLVAKIRVAARAKVKRPQTSAAVPAVKPATSGPTREVVGIAVSTGGPNALSMILTDIRRDFQPTILIVQHMPEGFTAQFAERLARTAGIDVREASDGEPVVPGCALIAPGGAHMELASDGKRSVVRLRDTDVVRGHRPSADVLFHSMATIYKEKAVGVIMTGMGEDGADGMLAIRRAGGHTLAQDEASSVVYGMPRAAIERDAIDRVVPLAHIAGYLNSLSRTGETRGTSWIA